MRTPLLLLAAGLPLAAADGVTTLTPETWDLGWNQRLAGVHEVDFLVGSGWQFRPVAPGVWGDAGIGVHGRTHRGTDPLLAQLDGRHDQALNGGLELDASYGIAWVHLGVDASRELGDAPAPRTVPEPRSTDSESRTTVVAPRLEAGVRLGPVAAIAGNLPRHWGPGIFGGVVLGQQADDELPAAALTTGEPLLLGYPFSYPLFLTLETLGAKPGGLDEAASLVGQRCGLRVGILEAGISGLSIDDHDAAAHDNAAAGDIALTIGEMVRISCEAGAYWSSVPTDDPQRLALVATIDAFDLTGQGGWRLAAEWHHAGEGTALPWLGLAHDQLHPLTHSEGGAGDSGRLLLQCDLDDGIEATWIAGLQRTFDLRGGDAIQRRWSSALHLRVPLGRTCALGTDLGIEQLLATDTEHSLTSVFGGCGLTASW